MRVRNQIIILILLLVLSGCQMLPAAQPSPTPQSVVTKAVVEPPSTATAEKTSLPPSPTAHPTSTPAPPEDLQANAMRPAAESDLAALRDLTHYTIDVQIDFDSLSFKGRQTVDYTNTERTPLDKLYFRLFPNGGRSYGDGSLTVSRVFVDGVPAEMELSLEDTALEVRLPAILQRHQAAQIVLYFEGTVPENFGDPEGRTGYGIYNFANNTLALADWYPILAVFDDEGWNLDPTSAVGDSVYADMAFYEVNVTAHSDLVIAATGTETLEQNLNGTTRYRYVSGPAREFFMILSPDFAKVTDVADGTTINSYYLPGHAAGGQAALQIAVEALETYNQRFGQYPYVELDVIDAPMQNAGGVEYPGIVLIGDFLYNNYRQWFFEVATAHEVAHQWWYNVVGNDVIDAPWMDEALATYSSAVYAEDVEGENAFQQMADQWNQAYEQAVEQGHDDLVTKPMQYWDRPENRQAYGTVVYLKGALFFQAVREEIGDDAFFGALQSYYAAQKYEIATPDDLLNVFEEAAGRQLDDLYQKWLYSAQS